MAWLRAGDVAAFNAEVVRRTQGRDDIVDLRGAQLRDLDLVEAHWWRCDLSDADLTGSRTRALVLAGARLRGTILDDVGYADDPLPVTQVRMLWEPDPRAWSAFRAGARMVVMSGCNLDGVVLAAVDLGHASMTSCRLAHADLRACTRMDELCLVGARMPGAIFPALAAFALDLQRAELGSARMEGMRLSSARLQDAHAEGASWLRSTWRDTLAMRLQARAANFDETTLDNVHFADADLRGATFRGASLSRCLLADADLRGCVFAGATFERCSFAGANVAGTRFEACGGLELAGAVNVDEALVSG